MNVSKDSGTPIARRKMMAGAAGATGVVALSSCASDAEQAPPQAPSGDAAPQQQALAKLSDIPVGGAVAVPAPGGRTVIVAQPEAGTAKAFDATCTHKGCTVNADGAELRCPCHGAVFEAASGAVLKGPATRPLEEVEIGVDQQGTVNAT